MTKDIYIIKNDINDKVYIGQSVNVKQRFQGHCKPSSVFYDNSIIDNAIQKYGKEHFRYEILESNVENFNEREMYWINKYNSIRPNGYNISIGGNGDFNKKGTEHPESVFSEDEYMDIVYRLSETNDSIRSIAHDFNVSPTTVSDLNAGRTYHNDNCLYPIRKTPHLLGKLSEPDIDEIISLLKNTNRTFEEIGSYYNVEARAISRINRGIFHKRLNEIYPIRETRHIKRG